MNFKEQFYFQKGNRIPKVIKHIDPDQRLAITCLPWGNSDLVESQLQKLIDFFASAKEDNEATSPFAKFSYLPTTLNNLIIASKLMNQSILKESNSEEYNTGVEFFACYKEGSQLAWTGFGGISLIVAKTDGSIITLQAGHNWSTPAKNLPNLPQQLMGLHKHIEMDSGYTNIEKDDKVFLVYQNRLQSITWKHSDSIASIEKFIDSNFKHDPDHSYWVAEIEL